MKTLPESYAIAPSSTPEKIGEYFNKLYPDAKSLHVYSYNESHTNYCFIDNEIDIYNHETTPNRIPNHIPILTFSEFERLAKIELGMDREIVGYKLIKDYPFVPFQIDTISKDNKAFLEYSKYPDNWQPIYKEEPKEELIPVMLTQSQIDKLLKLI